MQFQSTSFIFWGAIGLLGLIIGSFLNVLIYRLPRILQERWLADCHHYLQQHSVSPQQRREANPLKQNAMSLWWPASHCPHCKAPLKGWENIPLLSFIYLKGHCRVCQQKIAWRYPFTELLTAFLSVWVAAHFGLTGVTAAALILTWGLIALAAIDGDHQLLPDEITLPLLWLGLIVNAFGFFTDLFSALFGAIIGYLCLWLLYWLFKILTGKEGIGQGDFKLLALLGAWLGWQALPGIILFSSFVGAIVGISLIIAGKHKSTQPIPFGPFLALAGWLSLMWGKQVMAFYVNFILF